MSDDVACSAPVIVSYDEEASILLDGARATTACFHVDRFRETNHLSKLEPVRSLLLCVVEMVCFSFSCRTFGLESCVLMNVVLLAIVSAFLDVGLDILVRARAR